MLGSNTKQWMLGIASGYFDVAYIGTAQTTNINLAVASNFFGIPPDNSAITDIIKHLKQHTPAIL
jgi:hypothetical protein